MLEEGICTVELIIKRVYSSRYALSGIVICGHCGDIFRRIKWNNHGCRSTVWRCISRLHAGEPRCTARTVREELLHDVVVTAVNTLLGNKDEFLPTLQENIESTLGGSHEQISKTIDERLEDLQQELLKLANAKKNYEPVVREIYKLREQKQAIHCDDAARDGIRQRIQNMLVFLDEQPMEVVEYDDHLVRRLIEKITVFDDTFKVEFKSGIEIEIQM